MTKNCIPAVVERLFWQLGTRFSGRCRCREVAVVERFKQELMYGLSAGTKKSGRYREVAVVERWPLVEVRLYLNCMFPGLRKQSSVKEYLSNFFLEKEIPLLNGCV